MWKETLPWLALLASLLVLAVQRRTIGHLQSQLLTNGRTKRSVEDNSLYVPVFAQISVIYFPGHEGGFFQRKAMKRLCRQQSRRNVKHEHLPTTTEATIYRKKCTGDVAFTPPRLIAVRPHAVGSAMRDGDQWYVTEYHLGYNILHFTSTKSLNQSIVQEVYTLPYPFQGTDMAVFNGSAFFNSADDIVTHNFQKGSVEEAKLSLSKLPLYSSSTSIVDLQVEEHGLWAIFRKPGEKYLTVRRMVPTTLKVVSTWSLQDVESSDWCNAFIRCGMLYSVHCSEDGLQTQPVYDFYQSIQIRGKEEIFPDITNVSSVQYDPKSRSVVFFSAGKIFASQTF